MTTVWLNNAEMAAQLGIAVRTLHNYRSKRDFLIEGRHWRRATPSAGAHVLWNAELTEKAWLAELATVSEGQ